MAQYRPPVRKPVPTPATYTSEAQGNSKPNSADSVDYIETQMSQMRYHEGDDGSVDDYGMPRGERIGASAERSPGKVAGRNRDTIMFDPNYKRGTYIPYGGFDSIIDEYYTEGDPSTISIPAPSQLQRREQSRSPERANREHETQGQVPRVHENDMQLQHNVHATRADIQRQNSNTSAQSSKQGSIHGSPTRAHVISEVQDHFDGDHIGGVRGPVPEQYYVEDDQGGWNGGNHAMLEQHANAPPTGNAQHYETRPQRQRPQAQQRPLPDDGFNNTGHSRGPPLRAGPQPRDHLPQVQGSARGYPRSQGDPRVREQIDRERAMYQDPRLAPRPAGGNGDPRMRSAPNRQQMRMQNPQHQPDNLRYHNRPQGQSEYQYEGSQRTQRNMQTQRPSAPAESFNAPYPSGPSKIQPGSRAYNERPPVERLRSPPDGRIMADQRRPSPVQDQRPRGPSPALNGPVSQGNITSNRPHEARGSAGLGPQMQPSQAQRTQPSVVQETRQQQAGLPSAQQRPSTIPNTSKPGHASDMTMHAEPTGVVTTAELNALRREITKTKSPELQLTLVKRLIEASSVLASEGGKADPKQTKKNRDDYSREALRTLKQITAQDKPFPEAVFFLANCYGNGALSLEVDHERAFAMYEQAAKMRHPASAYRTAVCLEIGAGTRQDLQRAVRFYERAAEYGDPAAMYKLGMILLRGLLEQQADKRAAVTWLQKAAEQATIDNPHALHELALLYEKGDPSAGVAQNEAFAKDLFTQAAKLHYAPSQFRMGYAYEYGTLGCPVDPRRSIAWFSRGAERGDPESELSLSGWYLTGSEGILAQNDREAYLWGRKAAEKGLAKAEFAVGYFFESGIGTPIDIDEAVKWYKRAATAGQKKAQERLLALSKRKR